MNNDTVLASYWRCALGKAIACCWQPCPRRIVRLCAFFLTMEIYGSVQRESNLITVQQYATY